jgi:hypothetical protein
VPSLTLRADASEQGGSHLWPRTGSVLRGGNDMIQRGAMHIVASLRLATYLVLLSVPIAHTFSFILFVVASISSALVSLAGARRYRS